LKNKELKYLIKHSFNRNSAPPNTVADRPTVENVRLTSSLNPYPQQMKTKSVTPCGHRGHGQELCQVCHQRAKRNVPVYIHEERRLREAEDEKLLEQYQHNRDVEEHRKREVNSGKSFIQILCLYFRPR
jgi:hypothetical protein